MRSNPRQGGEYLNRIRSVLTLVVATGMTAFLATNAYATSSLRKSGTTITLSDAAASPSGAADNSVFYIYYQRDRTKVYVRSPEPIRAFDPCWTEEMETTWYRAACRSAAGDTFRAFLGPGNDEAYVIDSNYASFRDDFPQPYSIRIYGEGGNDTIGSYVKVHGCTPSGNLCGGGAQATKTPLTLYGDFDAWYADQVGAGNDVLNGGYAADFLNGGPGGDELFGHEAVDTISYMQAGGMVSVDLVAPCPNAGGVETDCLTAVDTIMGSPFGDVLMSQNNNNSNSLLGFGGNDVLLGGLGNDYLDEGSVRLAGRR